MAQLKFGIVSDVQYARQESRYPAQRPAPLGIKKLGEAVKVFNKYDDLEFIISLGDLIDHDPSNFPPILEVFSEVKFPVWHALGNHDFSGPNNEKGYKAEALAALGVTDDTRYYYKDVGTWRFIILDTNEVGTIEYKKDSPEWVEGQEYRLKLEKAGKINAMSWNGALSSKQMQWLEDSIDAAAAKDMNCIVFSHHGIYPEHRENALNDEEILALVSAKKNVKAYINGHNHDGNYGLYNGLHCWTIEGMMDFKDKTAYAVATIQDDAINIKGYGRVADRTMKLR
jgi:manganese-dependent ADP-ribose/CDP-alcohol diphosphatase